MNSEALVDLSLKALACSQKELASRLGVSQAQISKWKKGDYMSSEMEAKMRGLAGIGELEPSFVVWAGSLSDAKKWDRLIHYLADMAQEGAETGYNTYPLEDDLGLLSWHTFKTLRDIGVEIPTSFPKQLDFDYESEDRDWEVWEENPYADLIYEIFNALNDVYGFYAAYIDELIHDDKLDLADTVACNIEPCLMELAACKIHEPPAIATNFRAHKRKVTAEYEDWLTVVKTRAFRAGVPLKAELMDLVYGSADELSHSAEAESMGVNGSQIHPDIYINELLVGMRVIHQVLPAILKKLGIEDEFRLDTSELRVHPDR